MNVLIRDFLKISGREVRFKLFRSFLCSYRELYPNSTVSSYTRYNSNQYQVSLNPRGRGTMLRSFSENSASEINGRSKGRLFSTIDKNEIDEVSNRVKITGRLPKGLELNNFIYLVEKLPPFAKFLNMEVKEAGGGRLVCTLPFKRDFVGNMALPALHGGVIASLIDHVGGFAAWTTLVDTKQSLSTVDLRIDYIKPAPCTSLTCVGNVSYRGNSTIFVDMVVYPDIVSSEESKATIIALGRGTFSVRKNGNGDSICLNQVVKTILQRETSEGQK